MTSEEKQIFEMVLEQSNNIPFLTDELHDRISIMIQKWQFDEQIKEIVKDLLTNNWWNNIAVREIEKRIAELIIPRITINNLPNK